MTKIINRYVLSSLMFLAVLAFYNPGHAWGQWQPQTYSPHNQQNIQYIAQANTNIAQNSIGIQAPAPQNSLPGTVALPSARNKSRQGLTIEQVCELAIQNNPSVEQATRLMEAHYGSWVQAGLKNNPMVGYLADDMGGSNGAGRQGVTFSQEHVSRAKRDARQGAASAEYQAAQRMLMVQRQKVINDATLAAYRLLIAREKEYLSRELLKISQNAASAANELSQARETPKTDSLQAKIEMNRAQIALNDAVIEHEAAARALAVLMGWPEDMPLEIEDHLDHSPLEIDEIAVLRQWLADSPQLRQARAEWEAARARLRSEQKEAGMNVSAEGGVYYNTYEKQTEFSAGVAVPLRFNNRNQGNIMKAQSEMTAAARNMERVEKALTAGFYQQFAEYKTADQRVALYQESVLPDVEESLQLMMQSYQHGQSSYVELMNVQRTLFQVKMEYLDNLALLMASNTKIAGYLLEGAFDRPE
ncbi:MAG: TolC family protein [Planctomycetaceae bacterium]|nr:TolC family protein [Planctomycetaceae bacterium]